MTEHVCSARLSIERGVRVQPTIQPFPKLDFADMEMHTGCADSHLGLGLPDACKS